MSYEDIRLEFFNYFLVIVNNSNFFYYLDNTKEELPVIDIIDKACPQLIERCFSMLPSIEKSAAMTASAANSIDLQWIVDRNAPIWTAGIIIIYVYYLIFSIYLCVRT